MTGHRCPFGSRTLRDEVLGFLPDFIEHELVVIGLVQDPNGGGSQEDYLTATTAQDNSALGRLVRKDSVLSG